MLLAMLPSVAVFADDEDAAVEAYDPGESFSLGSFIDFGGMDDLAEADIEEETDSATIYEEQEMNEEFVDKEDEVGDAEEESGEETVDGLETMDCPVCGELISLIEEMLSSEEIVCPLCGEIIETGFVSIAFDTENAGQLNDAEYVLDEIIIGFYPREYFPGKEKQYDNEVAKVLKDGLAIVDGKNNVYLVQSDDFLKNPNATLNRFKNSRFIEYVEPNYLATEDAVPNDTNYSSMILVLTLLNAQAGWDIISGASGPVIAVVDSGIAQVPDLPPLLPGFSSVASLSPNYDKSGHGTGVAGTLGAVGNNKLGGVGINWNASIMPVKVDDANNTYTSANYAKGIIWAADNGADIISTSIGFDSDSVTTKNAIDYAYNKGCAIFAAAGNSGKVGICYPARYPNVMAVGASGNAAGRASASSYGPGMGVLANQSYNTTTSTGGYAVMAGTSFSTPQVAGLASLILGINPNLSNAQVYDLIQQGAKGNGVYLNDEIGYGFIHIANTLKLAQATAGGSSAAEAEAAAKAAAEAEAAAKAAAEAAAKAAAEAEAAAKAVAEAEAAAAQQTVSEAQMEPLPSQAGPS